ncbi:MAG: DUF2809 domain-containing protein [Leptolyngbyaceae cyanobacterium MO_188.B28]|nr:DUF2809 domain-containing protein [Leptolyngbyaceae cyanobacterium MO_188.B28]
MPPSTQKDWLSPDRWALLLSLGGIAVFALFTQIYPGPGRGWLATSFAIVPYTISWILVVALIWPTASAGRIAIGVLVFTCTLEVLQLWQPSWLQGIREPLLVRLAFGNTFNWSDFPYYAAGCGLGWLWLRWLQKRFCTK